MFGWDLEKYKIFFSTIKQNGYLMSKIQNLQAIAIAISTERKKFYLYRTQKHGKEQWH